MTNRTETKIDRFIICMATTEQLQQLAAGFPGYGYMPAPAPGERHAAAAYYADYGAPAHSHVAASHVANAVAARSEQSPMPISNSPMHRDQFSRTAGTSPDLYIYIHIIIIIISIFPTVPMFAPLYGRRTASTNLMIP